MKKIRKFDLTEIKKGMVISIILKSRDRRSEELYQNICTKLETMYAITRHENPSGKTDNPDKYLCITNTSKSQHDYAKIREHDYHNYIFKYFYSRCARIKSHFTFIIGHTPSVKSMYAELVDNKTYTLRRTCLEFKRHETIVVDTFGKMWYYDVESITDLIEMHQENYFGETMIAILISKILHNESVYHLPHGPLHQDLLHCSDIIIKCKRFMACKSNLPHEIRRVIITLVIASTRKRR